MQPDAAGMALATGVLAGVIAVFWFANRMISGPVADLSYTIGRQVARGVAEWATSRPPTGAGREIDAGQSGSDGGIGNGGDRGDGGIDGTGNGPTRELEEPVLVRVTGGRPRLRLECRLRGHRAVRRATLRGTPRPSGSAYELRGTRTPATGTIAA
jgi:hypothetical protein